MQFCEFISVYSMNYAKFIWLHFENCYVIMHLAYHDNEEVCPMGMNQMETVELLETLDALRSHGENEVVEFKAAKANYDFHKIGQYFSAISCEARLRNLSFGWLIFGVHDKTHEIEGTSYKQGTTPRHTDELLAKLKLDISKDTTDGLTFLDIFEVFPLVDGHAKRVLMFKIPAAAYGIPTGWKNQYYSRSGESLVPLTQWKIDQIRNLRRRDWSKEIVPNATILDLDPAAIQMARQRYKGKKRKDYIAEDIDAMNDETFLNKIKLIENGRITNACMLLLGKSERAQLMEFVPEIMWRLISSQGEIKDYEKFCIPFLLVVDQVFAKIRNLTFRYMPNQLTLFPQETQMYDAWMFRELLNNCIAHQDYSVGGRVYVDEYEDKLRFTNPGPFLPGDIPTVLAIGYQSPYYSNQLLTIAMSDFDMIDTVNSGIRRVYKILREKYFPLPDYDFSRSNYVSVEVYGRVMDERYCQILFSNSQLDLNDVYLIDRVQKKLPLEKEQIAHLRKLKVVEGRATSLYLSAQSSQAIDEQAKYIKNKGLDESFYRSLILNYLERWEVGTRKDFNDLLLDKLPDALSEQQKKAKVGNLLTAMRKEGSIYPDKQRVWHLHQGKGSGHLKTEAD